MAPARVDAYRHPTGHRGINELAPAQGIAIAIVSLFNASTREGGLVSLATDYPFNPSLAAAARATSIQCLTRL